MLRQTSLLLGYLCTFTLTPLFRRESITDRRTRIETFIAERGTVSAKTIGDVLAIPRATVNYDLRRMVDDRRIRRTTEDPKDKRAEYQILPKASKP